MFAKFFPYLWRVALTVPLVWKLTRLQPPAETADFILGMMGMGYSALIGLIWVGPIVEFLAGGSTRLYVPGDHKFDPSPEYSIAESRVKEGKIAEAIEAYQRYKQQHKREVTPHLKIAELQAKHFRDFASALVELRAALSKARDDDTRVKIHHLMADLHLEHRKDRASALDCLREVQRKYPGTPFARSAAQRAKKLMEGASAPSGMQGVPG